MIKLQEKQEEEKEWERKKQVLSAYCIHSKPGSYTPLFHLFPHIPKLLSQIKRKAPQMALRYSYFFPLRRRRNEVLKV